MCIRDRNKYLGADYTVLASYGHIRDLPSKNGSVDPENSFKMIWEVDSFSKKYLKEITDTAKNSDKIINMLKPMPITTPVSGWEIGQSFPSLAQLEIKIKNKEVKINSVIKVEPKWKLLSTSILSKRKKLFFKAITEKNAPIIWADM